MKTSKSGIAACLFVLLLSANAVEGRSLHSSSSSEDSASEAGTVLSFIASLPARRRSLLDRPASTCGEAAIPKDVEVEEIDTWIFSMAASLSLPRSACTAMGLQITAGAKSFTVFCLGNSGQLSAFSAGIIAGATVSSGTTSVLNAFDITFDGGSKVILEDNLKTRTAPGLPDAVGDCLLAFEVGTVIDNFKKRHLLRDPTAGEKTLIVEPFAIAILDAFAAATGIARDRWTAAGATIAFNVDGERFVLFTVLVRASPAESKAFIDDFQNITMSIGDAEFGSAPATVSENVFPDLGADLSVNLYLPVPGSITNDIGEAGGSLDRPTGTPIPTNNP
jgi:hypothetical protein